MVCYAVQPPSAPLGDEDDVRILEVGRNLFTGEAEFHEAFGEPTSLERDLLRLASAIFAADRATLRGERENISRRIKLKIPVVNALRLEPERPKIEQILRVLSHDAWKIEFVQAAGDIEPQRDFAPTPGRVLLFSGGMDSLAAAIEYGEAAQPLHLVSHKTRNLVTDRGQRGLVAALANLGVDLPHTQLFVSSNKAPPGNLNHDVENTQRTRSFVFLVAGALAARRLHYNQIVLLAENGPIAIHLPLSNARIGAFSTHTAHPDFLVRMSDFLTCILNFRVNIENPYVYRTKGEVVRPTMQQYPDLIPLSNSCWMNSHLPKGVTHCGRCIPCFIRRVAIEVNGRDTTVYNVDLWSEGFAHLPADDDGRRNVVELAEFVVRFESLPPAEVMNHWPSLYSPAIVPEQAMEMYRRHCGEVRTVLGRYPALAPLLT
jgi:7-cyano-7-deazaguanine synthase in queuosine biosynthesis